MPGRSLLATMNFPSSLYRKQFVEKNISQNLHWEGDWQLTKIICVHAR